MAANPMTTNHAYQRKAHVGALATPGIAPGPQVTYPSRAARVAWSIAAALVTAGVLALVMFATFAMLGTFTAN